MNLANSRIEGAISATPSRFPAEGPGGPEQAEGLVQQVRAEVVPEAAAGFAGLPPALAHVRPEAVEVGFEVGHPAQLVPVQERPDGEEIGVPAAVVEHRQDPSGLLGPLDQVPGLGGVQGERLVHHHVLAGGQRLGGQGVVAGVGGGDDHQVDVRPGEQVFRPRVHCHPGQAGPHLGRIAAGHGHQLQAGHRLHQRGVEDPGGEAVAHDPDLQRTRHATSLPALAPVVLAVG